MNVHPFKRSIAVLTTPSNSLVHCPYSIDLHMLSTMITLQAQFVQCNVGNWSCSENAFSFTYTGTSSDSGDSVLVSPALSQEATSVLCMEPMDLEICLYGATLSFSTAPMEVHTHTI